MSTAIWGESVSPSGEVYPSLLLKHLLRQMMLQFAANGACIALYDERSGQMEIQLHIRFLSTQRNDSHESLGTERTGLLNRRTTNNLANEQPTPSPQVWPKQLSPTLTELVEVSPQQSDLFPVGTTYRVGQDLIGAAWRNNEIYIMRHEEYIKCFHPDQQIHLDILPSSYLVVPLPELTLIDDLKGLPSPPRAMGVIVLYRTESAPGFQQQLRSEALRFAERIALYLQNDQLRRAQHRTTDYMQRLQDISAAFPSTVKLSTLMENAHQFAANLVDVSSMLITLYDRDSGKIYDVYASHHGSQVEGLPAAPVNPEDRPIWCKMTLQDRRSLLFSPAQQERPELNELLIGVWGDQRQAQTFLFLPMKMFNRVVGSLCLVSMQPNAYRSEEIQVLETMVQIITVGIENARLYERAHQSLLKAQQREELLAAVNSALQVISSVLDTNELLHKFVESTARLVQAEMSIFFQLSPDKEQLIARATFEASKADKVRDAYEPPLPLNTHKVHADLIEMIRLPFKGSILEHLVQEGFFYLDPSSVEALTQASEKEGAMFLREMDIQKMLMIPVLYQTDIVGILAIHTPKQNRFFRPNQVGILLAICAQVAGAIRNAQLFEEIQEAYAEQQRLDKLKDEFLVTASHELRTPLSAISGYATLLKRQKNRTDPQNILRYATKIVAASQQLTDLVASMTEATKLGSVDKKLELQFSSVPVASAVEMAISMISANVEQKIVSHVDSKLWVKGDPLRVRQVITNLLDNATKYSPPDSPIKVTAAAATLFQVPLPEDQADFEKDLDLPVVLVHVHDEGEGILPEDQQKIFEKFVRAPRSLTTTVRGSGLGLYICRRYIEAMGGKLWLAHSVVGEGSAFCFYLPQVEAPITDSEQDELGS